MTKLPENKTKTAKRVRVMLNNGEVWHTWYMVTEDGTLIIDPQGYGQHKAGTWRYILERETKTITYEEYDGEA